MVEERAEIRESAAGDITYKKLLEEVGKSTSDCRKGEVEEDEGRWDWRVLLMCQMQRLEL